jgi:nucleoside 2-deoxyribosyltransferase
MYDIFISYSRRDKQFVSSLAADLRTHGYDVVIDLDLETSGSWADALGQAIEETDIFLSVLSPDYISSPWTQEELSLAVAGNNASHRTVIPLLVRECEPPLVLASRVPVDFNDYAAGLRTLLHDLEVHAYSRQSAEHGTDGSARALAGTLHSTADVTVLDEQVEELREAVRNFKTRAEPPSALVERSAAAAPHSGRMGDCFIVMPFGDRNLDLVYEDAVKPVLEDQCGLRCIRGDDVFGSNVVMDDIMSGIVGADLVVADLTGKNPNVLYEVGIAHALEKRVLLLAQAI